jgi:hypothetical protein
MSHRRLTRRSGAYSKAEAIHFAARLSTLRPRMRSAARRGTRIRPTGTDHSDPASADPRFVQGLSNPQSEVEAEFRASCCQQNILLRGARAARRCLSATFPSWPVSRLRQSACGASSSGAALTRAALVPPYPAAYRLDIAPLCLTLSSPASERRRRLERLRRCIFGIWRSRGPRPGYRWQTYFARRQPILQTARIACSATAGQSRTPIIFKTAPAYARTIEAPAS